MTELAGENGSAGGRQAATRQRQTRDDFAPGGGILIVEDELMVAWSFESQLEDAGYSVAGIVSTGEAAIARIADDPPELILMDINLGAGIDGIEAARRIRDVAPIQVIFISAYSDPETRERLENAMPGSAFLSKPVTFAALDRAIREVTGRRH